MRTSDAEVDTSGWSGEGEFTARLLECLRPLPQIAALRVEDAPASRSDADYHFMSNELFVRFSVETTRTRTRRWGLVPVTEVRAVKAMTMAALEKTLAAIVGVGEPDYADESMLQYLRTQRIVPPYQTRGYKLVELVRIYEIRNPES